MKKYIIKTPEIKKNCLAAIMEIMGDQNMEVIIQEHTDDKTREQESFFHVLCRELSRDTGYTEGEIKELIKQEILGTTVVKFAGRAREVTSSSAKASRPQYSELIEGAYKIGAEAGVILPPPLYRE